MQVEVRLFAALREGRFGTQRLELAVPCPVRDLLQLLSICEGEVFLCLVNGQHSKLDRKLADGDVVSLFPAVGGG
ncbi:MAG: MoaD/ThiS family protein [Planctomycetota bacterium]|nr:MoaD/ThiS family protein [Planctomycetota bacterium]